jgi:hypothetical protein
MINLKGLVNSRWAKFYYMKTVIYWYCTQNKLSFCACIQLSKKTVMELDTGNSLKKETEVDQVDQELQFT